jgi:hypothetical protein
MNKIMLSLTAAASLIIAHNASADLGQTKDYAISTFGQPIQVEGNQCSYKSNGWLIHELYNDAGRAIVVTYYYGAPMTYQVMKELDRRNLPPGIESSDFVEQKTPGNLRWWVSRNNDYSVMAGRLDSGNFIRMYSTAEGDRAIHAWAKEHPDTKQTDNQTSA